MSKIIEHDIPMWGIGGDVELDQKAETLADLRQKINVVEKSLEEVSQSIHVISSRSSLYIKNVMNAHHYNHIKHMLFIDQNYKASIYNLKDVHKVGSISELPPPSEDNVFQLTKKQADKIVENIQDYDMLIDDYDELIESYEDLMAYHDEIWDYAIDVLSEFTGFQVYNDGDTEEVEPFDTDKHVLLVVRDEDYKWVFRYIKKEDEEQFNELVQDELTN